jgi:hypothetical protein
MSNQFDAAKRTLAGLGYTWDGEYWHPPVAQQAAAIEDASARDVAVMLIVRTSDAAMFPENLDLSTVRSTKALRRAVIANLPKVSRVVSVMDEETARVMCAAHAYAADVSGFTQIRRPPPDYRGPNDGVPPVFPGERRR